jgi:DNA-binding LacI/PurR family transcriptional regulator
VPSIEVAVPFRENWYFDTVCSGIEQRAAAGGVDVHVITELPGAAGREVITERFDAALGREDGIGAVAVGFEFERPQVERLLAHGKTVVAIGGPSDGLPSIFPDDAAVGRAATQHLLDLGHRSISHLAGYALSADDFSMRSDRVRGYSEAMRDAGLEEESHVVPCEFTPEAAYRAATTMLSARDRPTAVFAVADELALSVLDAARDLGLQVPRDLSVIGIDDHVESAARGLTTWRQDARAVGVLAAERALGVAAFDREVVELTLVRRSTTAEPGAGSSGQQRAGGLARLFRRGR